MSVLRSVYVSSVLTIDSSLYSCKHLTTAIIDSWSFQPYQHSQRQIDRFKNSALMEDSRLNKHRKELFKDEFTKDTFLDDGGEGRVHKVYHVEFREIAVKYYKRKTPMENIQREIEHLLLLTHPHIIQAFGYVYDNRISRKLLGYAMEYMAGSSVYSVIHNNEILYTLDMIFKWTDQATSAFHYLHSRQHMHRDVSAKNMMLSNDREHLKICDFGKARIEIREPMTLFVGCVHYMAPEMLSSDGDYGHYSSKCEVYSIGIVIWEMFTRQALFPEFRHCRIGYKLAHHIMNEGVPPLEDVKSPSLKAIITLCLKKNPDDRPTMLKLQDTLRRCLHEMTPEELNRDIFAKPLEDVPIAQNANPNNCRLALKSGTKRRRTGYMEEHIPNKKRSDIPQFLRNEFSSDFSYVDFGEIHAVYKSTHHVHGNVAIKISSRNPSIVNHREVATLLKIVHPNIIKTIGYLIENHENETHTSGYVMEFMGGGNLLNVIHSEISYSRTQLVSWAKQAASALEYIHSIELIHRNVTPFNLLFSQDLSILKLGGFGHSRELATEMTFGVGAASYMAPELIKLEERGSYTEQCDIYSLGIIIWEMVTRKCPYPDWSYISVIMQVAEGMRPPTSEVQQWILPLIQSCWDNVPENRPTAAELNHLLDKIIEEHPNEADLEIEKPV